MSMMVEFKKNVCLSICLTPEKLVYLIKTKIVQSISIAKNLYLVALLHLYYSLCSSVKIRTCSLFPNKNRRSNEMNRK